MNFKKIITIIGICLIFFNSLSVKANDMPTVGINGMIKDITEDQAKWAYSKKLGEELQEKELRLMSAIIWAEAGNQCEAGKQAVGIVVMNRVANDAFEDDVESVIYEKGQFQPRSNGTLNKALIMYDEGELPQECVDAAIYALNNNTTVIYNGVEIDMTPYLYFARDLKNERMKIQDHEFK